MRPQSQDYTIETPDWEKQSHPTGLKRIVRIGLFDAILRNDLLRFSDFANSENPVFGGDRFLTIGRSK